MSIKLEMRVERSHKGKWEPIFRPEKYRVPGSREPQIRNFFAADVDDLENANTLVNFLFPRANGLNPLKGLITVYNGVPHDVARLTIQDARQSHGELFSHMYLGDLRHGLMQVSRRYLELEPLRRMALRLEELGSDFDVRIVYWLERD